MHNPKFLAFSAAAGLVWGAGFVLLGFLAGSSYEAVAKTAGRGITAVIVAAAVAALIIWRIRKSRGAKKGTALPADGPDDERAGPAAGQ